MSLYPDQLELKTNVMNAWDEYQNILMVLPCGGGKTRIFTSIVQDESAASVVLTHRAELVLQISLALAHWEVQHRVIGPKHLVNACIEQHIIEVGRNYVNPSARCGVASVNTLVSVSSTDSWFRNVRLWVTDECFPAGTLIDGIPIETLKVGDNVTAFNEHTGTFEKCKITHVFKNKKPNNMMRIESESHHVITSTANHPVWTKRGWVEAENINTTDEVLIYDYMYDVRKRSRCDDISQKSEVSKNRKGLLSRSGLFCRILSSNFVRNDGRNKPKICIGPNENKQSDAECRMSSKSIKNFKNDWSQTESTRWKWKTRGSCGKGNERVDYWIKFSKSIRDLYRTVWERISDTLQNRPCESSVKNSNRSGRRISQFTGETRARQSERSVSYWSRVESVEVQKQRSSANPTDGFVYNIEVDKLNTYVANGIVVHNCHHSIRGGMWEKCINLFPKARGLGVTATPKRSDGKGLGRHADGFFDILVVGKTMRELITMGRLCDYRLFSPPSDLDISQVPVGASGDFQSQPLRRAVQRSHLVGDIVQHYLNYAPGLRAIVFTVDIESAEDQAAAFRRMGIPAKAVSGKTDPITRRQAIRDITEGRLLILCNCDVFGEGTDLPAVECVIFGRPSQSEGLVEQQFGRALRLSPGKTHGIIIDPVRNIRIDYGNVALGRHPLPDAAKTHSLDRQEKRSRSDTVPSMVRTCLECLAVYDKVKHGMICPYCKTAHVPAQRSGPEFVDGDLGEVDPAILERSRRAIDAVLKPPYIPQGASRVVVNSIMKNHREHVAALSELHDAILHDAKDVVNPSEYQRAFYLKHGIDVLTARTLGKKEAVKLKERLMK